MTSLNLIPMSTAAGADMSGIARKKAHRANSVRKSAPKRQSAINSAFCVYRC